VTRPAKQCVLSMHTHIARVQDAMSIQVAWRHKPCMHGRSRCVPKDPWLASVLALKHLCLIHYIRTSYTCTPQVSPGTQQLLPVC
jgi:hypothetical protein